MTLAKAAISSTAIRLSRAPQGPHNFRTLGSISISKRYSSAPFSLSAPLTLTSLTSVEVDCSTDDDPNGSAANVNLSALPVGSIIP